MMKMVKRALGAIGGFIKFLFLHARFHIWALWAVGPVFLLVYGVQLTVVLSPFWPDSLRGEQLKYVGIASWISLGIIAASIVLVGQMVKRVSARVGAVEFEFESHDQGDDGDNDDGGVGDGVESAKRYRKPRR